MEVEQEKEKKTKKNQIFFSLLTTLMRVVERVVKDYYQG
jgi:hypothetical protein